MSTTWLRFALWWASTWNPSRGAPRPQRRRAGERSKCRDRRGTRATAGEQRGLARFGIESAWRSIGSGDLPAAGGRGRCGARRLRRRNRLRRSPRRIPHLRQGRDTNCGARRTGSLAPVLLNRSSSAGHRSDVSGRIVSLMPTLVFVMLLPHTCRPETWAFSATFLSRVIGPEAIPGTCIRAGSKIRPHLPAILR
jgi:hypothetical protein